MCNFADDARGALGGVEMELKKFRDWLEREQLAYWQMQVKKRQEMLMEARAALHKKQLSAGKNSSVSDSEEKENVRIVTRLLRVAEEKVVLVKKLIPQFHHAVAEYHSNSQPLGDHMSAGFERSLGRMTGMIDALERYLALQAPDTASALSSMSQSSAPASKATTAPATREGQPKEAEESPVKSSEATTVEAGLSAPNIPQTQEVQP